MGRVLVTNVDAETAVVLVGDPAADGPHKVVRLKQGESQEFVVQGDPDSDEFGSEVLAITADGPWTDEIENVDDGHDGSLQ